MCGIYGWFLKTGGVSGTEAKDWAYRIADSMACRGPDFRACLSQDRQSVWRNLHSDQSSDSRLVMGHNRLSIIDLSAEGNQPMQLFDGRYTITFNGEIYNYIELREELRGDGANFRTNSDTEVLVAAYDRWKLDALNKLKGMYAFALFDRVDKQLICARDPFGIKPFYYHDDDKVFCFASELPALLEFPGIERNLNSRKAFDYLNYGGTDVSQETMVASIRQLEPGHCMIVSSLTGKVETPRRYWDLDLSSKCQLPYEAACEQLREKFLQSVKLHLRSDVPVGIALSGGIDSSAVTCAVRRIEPDADIRTFSYIAEGGGAQSEEAWVDIVNNSARSVGHKVRIKPQDLGFDVDSLIARLGEPFKTTSIYAQYRVFKLAQENGITVALEGQGADEMFAGYDGYPADRIASLVRKGRLAGALNHFRTVSKVSGRSSEAVAKEVARRLTPDLIRKIKHRINPKGQPGSWINDSFFLEKGIDFRPIRGERKAAGSDRLIEALAYAATRQGLQGLLRHGDRNSMSWSIESRVPFCTPEIAEFALSLPEEYLVDSKGTSKRIFRDSMRGIVPDCILDRKDKIGFSTPERDWLLAMPHWVEEVLDQSRYNRVVNILDLQNRWQRLQNFGLTSDAALWRSLNFLRWMQLFKIKDE
ncbi:MAG: asparagine synthase (glutamine-hydrolyzing) [Mobilitalea sp.]